MSTSFTLGHALLIGVGSYQRHPHLNAPVMVRDAQAVQTALTDPDLCGYPASQVMLLHDAGAAKASLLAAFDHLAQKTDASHTVVIFYCGHGDYGSDGHYYLTTHDTQVAAGRIAPGTGLLDAELLDRLRRIPAKRLLLLFNACYAGSLSPALDIEESPAFGALSLPAPTGEAILASGEGRILITACRPEQRAYIGHGQLTLFTQALVDGLSGKGYAASNHGYISAYNLYESIYRHVQSAVGRLRLTQEPELTVIRGVGPFPVALFRGASSLGTFDAAEPLPEDTAVRQVQAARSQRFFQQIIQTIANGDRSVAIGGSANGALIQTGDGTQIRGDGNTVVGPDGVHIGGSVQGDVVTGKKISQQAGNNAIQVGEARDVTITKGRPA